MFSDAERFLALLSIPGLGPARIKALSELSGGILSVWSAGEDELSAAESISPRLAAEIVRRRGSLPLREIMISIRSSSYYSLSDPAYPKNLYNIYDPPPVLFKRGELLPCDGKAVAIVGTRTPSDYGRQVARALARDLARCGVTVVSGLAEGIDTCAHDGALEAGGRTIAVIAGGLDKIYPASNVKLAERISSAGAVVTELAPGREMEKWNFPRRNRIISGLSLGTVVVEGSGDSGSLITARTALDQNREVFAVPGQVTKELSSAPNSLIKQGAKLVQNVEDILEELNISARVPAGEIKRIDLNTLHPDDRKLVEALSGGPKHIDSVCGFTSMPFREVSARLIPLVISGVVRELPGKYFDLSVAASHAAQLQ